MPNRRPPPPETYKIRWGILIVAKGEKRLSPNTRQPELIALLEQLRADGVKVTPLTDRDADGSSFLLKEIDPFTFFATFNRGIREKERVAILSGVKKLLQAQEPLPEDFSGIPIVNNQKSWFIAYQPKRTSNDVPRLWRVFRLALTNSPLENPEFAQAFDQALEVWGTSTNLTMGLFWIRPDTFLNLDQTNRTFLKIDLPPEGLSAAFYVETVKSVFKRGKPFAELSFDAWRAAQSTDPSSPSPEAHLSSEKDYWLVGAFWDASDPPDQTERFKEEGIWQNGYQDRHLDLVKSMKVGDRIAIKAAFTQKKNLPFDSRGRTVSRMTIKAIGTIVANRNDGRTVEVEWEEFEPKDWYFFTNQQTIWRLRREPDYQYRQYSEKLIDFIWRGIPQDYEWFCNKWWDSDETAALSKKEGMESVATEPFGIEDMVAAGVFLAETDLEQIIGRLKSKKNVIIQGAPGVGKTFLARMLGFALMEEKDNDRIQFVQFHQTYSYEDFVRGYRPLPDEGGTFGLQDSVFFKFCKQAETDPERDYVFIIDEINRGNLSQIFGELLMLIEGDKRGQEHAVELVYQRPGEGRFFVPSNVYIIGLMNLADRSLAVVDYALRRRFAFVTLTPQYESALFRKWLSDRGMKPDLVDLIVQRISALNQEIRDDVLLGENYQVGHSFFCPRGKDFSGLDRQWYEDVIQTEIIPLLKEYWFDNSKRLDQVRESLLVK
jgi:5-methylcytosine-specific restriction protein B